MSQASNHVRKIEPSPYATCEDFIHVFHEDMDGLYQLSLLLAGDHERAEKCFVAGIENCVKENRVFREWARSWAKRVIVQNAIRELKPRPNLRTPPSAPVFLQSLDESALGEDFDVDLALRLGDFERFVFAMAVLEHYSHHECALLLGCSVLEIRESLRRALEQLASSEQTVSCLS